MARHVEEVFAAQVLVAIGLTRPERRGIDARLGPWYVLDGELTFRLGETSLPAPAGSFVLAPGGTPHSQVNSGPGPAE
jgi:Cupin domain